MSDVLVFYFFGSFPVCMCCLVGFCCCCFRKLYYFKVENSIEINLSLPRNSIDVLYVYIGGIILPRLVHIYVFKILSHKRFCGRCLSSTRFSCTPFFACVAARTLRGSLQQIGFSFSVFVLIKNYVILINYNFDERFYIFLPAKFEARTL